MKKKQSDRIYIPRSPKIKGRKMMRKLSRSRVTIAHERMTGFQALKFLHPRRLRNAILNKQIPEGTFTPNVSDNV